MKFGRALRICLLLLAIVVVAAAGCRTSSGSREFIPGKGWRPT